MNKQKRREKSIPRHNQKVLDGFMAGSFLIGYVIGFYFQSLVLIIPSTAIFYLLLRKEG